MIKRVRDFMSKHLSAQVSKNSNELAAQAVSGLNRSSLNYKSAGVDVEAGDALVDWLQADADVVASNKMPHHERVLSGIGGFASLFRADFPEMKKPCLVTCTDGVGTKVKLAAQFSRYDGVGQDLVAMCVNDLICTGGRPLLFLDYYAVAKLDLSVAKQFLNGVKKACALSDSALVGGETAEMPGVYHHSDFDCAGFAVGVVDEDKRIGGHLVQAGDVLLGISSSGFHSNGYSLLRKVFAAEIQKGDPHWVSILLEPTALYVQVMKQLMQNTEIHASAHITGGGIENIPRVLPEHLDWQMQSWPLPEIFLEVQRRTQMSDDEIRKTLNCGIGFVIVLPPSQVARAKEIILQNSFQVFDLGVMRGKT